MERSLKRDRERIFSRVGSLLVSPVSLEVPRRIANQFTDGLQRHLWMIGRCVVVLVFCSLWCVSPIFAETKSKAATPAPSQKELDLPIQPKEIVPHRYTPFAQYEKRLKSSDKWETLTPEEQQEALAKIRHYQQLYLKQQSKLEREYKSLLEKKKKKRSSLSRRRQTESKNKFEYVWSKWQKLTPYREKILSKKWKIPNVLPNKRRAVILKVWKRLLPVTRLQFIRDID